MRKVHKQTAARGKALPRKASLVAPAADVLSDDVEKVLEHISSPYRWELLEVPPVKPETSMPGAATKPESRSKR